jgi:trimeric autotransporter adhesin
MIIDFCKFHLVICWSQTSKVLSGERAFHRKHLPEEVFMSDIFSAQRRTLRRAIHLGLLLAVWLPIVALAQTPTAFTYQGRLTDNAATASGIYHLQFSLFSAASGGAQIGATIENTNVSVSNGVFTVQLDFGSAPFTSGADRFLEIAVKRPAEAAYTPLSPRQPITASPYAIRALSAATAETATTAETAATATTAETAATAMTATNAQQLGGVAANQYVLTGDARLSDARQPTAGSANYLQNTTSPQASANFNIAGNGTAGGTLSGNTVNAATQYNLGGSRVLSIAGTENLFVGIRTGAANTTGTLNLFLGHRAGESNTTGRNNSFVGRLAGFLNTEGNDNSFFGRDAGPNNTTGVSNLFIGAASAFSNTTGNGNSFLGVSTGSSNTTGSNNTLVGFTANVVTGNLTFATAIGAGATVAASNTIALGRSADDVRVPGTLTVTGALNASGASLTSLNASNLTTGTLNDARLSSNVARRDTAQTFVGNQTVTGNLTVNGDVAQTGTSVSFNPTNGLLVTGTADAGAIPATGAGVRLMWYPNKSAFRAGRVTGTQWDNAKIGDDSTALGKDTTASGSTATAMGQSTTASGEGSTALGLSTEATALGATALGLGAAARGLGSTALGSSTSASGSTATAMGNSTIASGSSSTAMGTATVASGDFSTAMGTSASTRGHSGSFVYGDASPNPQLQASAPNQFAVRAQHIWLGKDSDVTDTASRFIETSTGAFLSNGGAWTNSSSRALKTNFAPVNSRDVLRGVLQLPLTTWNYKAEEAGIRHLGPIAQDFYQTFKLGADDQHIGTVDSAGVALAAIQGLHEELTDRDQQIAAQQSQIRKQQTQIEQQQKTLARQQSLMDGLRKLVCQQNRLAEVCKEN